MLCGKLTQSQVNASKSGLADGTRYGKQLESPASSKHECANSQLDKDILSRMVSTVKGSVAASLTTVSPVQSNKEKLASHAEKLLAAIIKASGANEARSLSNIIFLATTLRWKLACQQPRVAGVYTSPVSRIVLHWHR